MKKFLFGITFVLGLIAVPRPVGAQGTVSFAGAMVMTNIWGNPVTGKISPASNYHFGLYFGATEFLAFESTRPVLVITPAANAFPGQISSAVQTLVGVQPGEKPFFVIKGWDGIAPTYEDATSLGGGYQLASFVGVSDVGQITSGLGGGTAPPFFLFTGPGGIGANGLVLVEDPEPSTLVLSSLGLAALAIHIRRRKICELRKPCSIGT